jgi:hypothetical protein
MWWCAELKITSAKLLQDFCIIQERNGGQSNSSQVRPKQKLASFRSLTSPHPYSDVIDGVSSTHPHLDARPFNTPSQSRWQRRHGRSGRRWDGVDCCSFLFCLGRILLRKEKSSTTSSRSTPSCDWPSSIPMSNLQKLTPVSVLMAPPLKTLNL